MSKILIDNNELLNRFNAIKGTIQEYKHVISSVIIAIENLDWQLQVKSAIAEEARQASQLGNKIIDKLTLLNTDLKMAKDTFNEADLKLAQKAQVEHKENETQKSSKDNLLDEVENFLKGLPTKALLALNEVSLMDKVAEDDPLHFLEGVGAAVVDNVSYKGALGLDSKLETEEYFLSCDKNYASIEAIKAGELVGDIASLVGGAALIVDGGSNDAIGVTFAAPTLGASLALDAVGTVEIGEGINVVGNSVSSLEDVFNNSYNFASINKEVEEAGSKLSRSNEELGEGEAEAEWEMPVGGGTINGRRYSQHAMERMAPNTPEVKAELYERATKLAQERGLVPQTKEYSTFVDKYVDPRNIPPSVIEDAIKNAKPIPGNRPDTFLHEAESVKVVVNGNGDVITVIPK